MHKSQSGIHRDTPEIVLKSIFRRYDIDGNGYLDRLEFTNALEDLGIIESMEQDALFALADTNNKKCINYTDFFKLIKSNDFESILSSHTDYEFIIETYIAFQQYDNDGDGEVTWSEFYFYLSKHGYSHQNISQYWYYMNTNSNKQTISFEEFWKGFKAQHKSLRYNRQKQINKEITNNETQKRKNKNKNRKRKKKYNKTLGINKPSFKKLIRNNSWNSPGNNNIFNYMKTHLTPSKHLRNISPFTVKTGKVIDNTLKQSYSTSNLYNNNINIKPILLQSHSVNYTPPSISLSLSLSNSDTCNEFNFIDYELDRNNSISIPLSESCHQIKPKTILEEHQTILKTNSEKKKKKKKKKNGKYKRKKNKKKKGKNSKLKNGNIDRRSVLFPRKKKSSHKVTKSK